MRAYTCCYLPCMKVFNSHCPSELVFGHVVLRPLLLLKEEWLDEDLEKISVPKYVAYFKDMLFRAGQMAKSNDSNDVGTGAVLLQEASDGLDHPVSYFSKKFLQYQKKYSVVEKETLGLVLALDYFDIYLCSTPLKIKVYTDRNPLNFLKQWKIRIKG